MLHGTFLRVFGSRLQRNCLSTLVQRCGRKPTLIHLDYLILKSTTKCTISQSSIVRRSIMLSSQSATDKVSSESAASPTEVGELSSEERKPGIPMLKKILHALQRQNLEFTLPFNDDSAMKSITESFRLLMNAGVTPEFLIDACVQRPVLFEALARQGKLTYELLSILVDDCAMTYEDGMRMLASYKEELMAIDAESLLHRLDAVRDCGIDSNQTLGRLVRECPALLFARDGDYMRLITQQINAFFSRSQIESIVLSAPHILLQNFKELESKYEYIYFRMGLTGKDFVGCRGWVDLSLTEIMTRHEFLTKTGKYTLPDEKRSQLKMENPSLKEILDSSDKTFAHQIAGVSLEEWNVYQNLAEKLREMSEKERPYERIKPSQRKAFERRWKEKKAKESHVLED